MGHLNSDQQTPHDNVYTCVTPHLVQGGTCGAFPPAKSPSAPSLQATLGTDLCQHRLIWPVLELELGMNVIIEDVLLCDRLPLHNTMSLVHH